MKKISICLILIGVLLLVQSAAAVPPNWSQPVFGVVEGYERPAEALGLGAGWERIIFEWAVFQPEPGVFNTGAPPVEYANIALGGGRQVVGLVKGTPGWAAQSGAFGGVPSGLDLPLDDPQNHWAAFVRQLVAGVPAVQHWIVWNEPNIRPGEGHVEFEGNEQDYYHLLKTFYLVAKAVNPNVHVQMAGMSWHHDTQGGRSPFVERLLAIIAADPDAAANNHYFDGVTLHIYFTTSSVWQIINATQNILNRYGLGGKQVWLAEFNASPRRDPAAGINAAFMVSLEQQADYIAQAAALALAAGVSRMAVYKLYDNNYVPGVSEPWGLVRFDGSLRPAYDAYRNVIARYSGAADVSRLDLGGGTAVIFAFGGHTLYVLWNNGYTPGQFLIGSGGAPLEILDALGVSQGASPVEGAEAVIDAPPAEAIDMNWVVVAGAVRMVTAEGAPRSVRFR